MLVNDLKTTSNGFEKFLQFLGDKIRLAGWKGFRGGLDVIEDRTGEFSVFAKWNGYDIMFHVGPFLPRSPSDHQSVQIV